MKAPIVKSGGLLATYEGVRLTRDQMELSKSGYIYEVPTWDGTIVYVDAEKEDSSYGRYINNPLDDSMVNAKGNHERGAVGHHNHHGHS